VTFHVLTLFPEIFRGYLDSSILQRAISRGLIRVNLVNIRDFATDRHRTCDDYTFGGGAGMILKPEPLARSLEAVGCVEDRRDKRTVFLSPSGALFRQELAEELAREEELVLLCGRYEGVDQRIIDSFVTDEISIGDYILSGGEVAAMAIIDSVSRLVAGVIRSESLEEESFRRHLLEYPQYTRPAEFRGRQVPEVLLSGHHAEITRWRLKKSLEKTLKVRPELLAGRPMSAEIERLIEEIRQEGEPDGHH
jgi:tRNA (guanine37-N1)-methyltransferase